MNHITVPDELVSQLLEGAAWHQIGHKLEKNDKTEKVDETNMFGNEEEVLAEDSEQEVDVCPMCESELDEALSDETIMECVETICEVLEELNEESTDEDDEGSDDAQYLTSSQTNARDPAGR